MSPDPAKEKTQNGPEKPEPQKIPEVQQQTLNPEQAKIAEQRLERKDFISKEDLLSPESVKRLKEIKNRKQQIETEQTKLQQEASTKRAKETWPDNKPETGFTDGFARDKINSKVEEKFAEYQKEFEDAGLGDQTNITIIKQTAKEMIFDYYQKNGRDNDKTLSYVKGQLLDKLRYVTDSLKQIFESKKHGYNKPVEVMEAFSKYTKDDFMKDGYLQPGAFKDFLLFEKSTYETQVTDFAKSLGLTLEKKDLEGEETTLVGKKLGPKELIEQKRLSLNKIRITVPKDAKDLDATLQTEIPKALPPIDDKEVKQKIVDYLAGEFKKNTPQPDQIFELSPDGKWNKIDVAVETKAKEETKQQVEQQVAQTASSTEQKSEGFSFDKGIKSVGDFILEIFRWIMKLFGVKMGGADIEDMLKEWKDVTPEERAQMKEFYGSSKKFFSGMNNIQALIKSPDDMRLVLNARKVDSKQNETWDAWIQRHLSAPEQEEINISKTIQPKEVANKLISPNSNFDKPAQIIQQNQAPGQKPGENKNAPDAPNDRAKIIFDRMESSPYTGDLKTILDAYIAKKSIKAQSGTISDYISGMTDGFLKNHPDIGEKYQKGQMTMLDLSETIFNDVFNAALLDAKTPEDKEKINKVLSQFNGTLDTILTERGKPGTEEPQTEFGNFAKDIEDLNKLKASPDWKQKLPQVMGINLGTFDGIRMYTTSANNLDPEIRDYLQKFLQTYNAWIEQGYTKIESLFPGMNRDAPRSPLYQKEITAIKNTPNWRANIEQQLKNSKDFRLKCYFIAEGLGIDDIPDADVKEFLVFLKSQLTPTLKAQMGTEVGEFFGIKTQYETFAKDFPGFESLVKFIDLPPEIIDPIIKAKAPAQITS